MSSSKLLNKPPYNSDTVVYHGNENSTHRFSELRPSFFTSDKDYAGGYGNFVYAYTIDSVKPFDTATDEEARRYFNEEFLNDTLGKESKYLNKGESIHFNDADNFWAFLAVEALLNPSLGYDSIIVNEMTGNHFKTQLSIVPLCINQIKPIMD
ncbi:hypothetical protein VCHA53O466_40436 [Vibrio chagasii]|nr:hypothetical protein VCHA53O466_40436 [Vibrio chagasii]